MWAYFTASGRGTDPSLPVHFAPVFQDDSNELGHFPKRTRQQINTATSLIAGPTVPRIYELPASADASNSRRSDLVGIASAEITAQCTGVQHCQYTEDSPFRRYCGLWRSTADTGAPHLAGCPWRVLAYPVTCPPSCIPECRPSLRRAHFRPELMRRSRWAMSGWRGATC